MDRRERAVVAELSDALAAVRGVENPMDAKGMAAYGHDMMRLSPLVSRVLQAMVERDAEEADEVLRLLREVMQGLGSESLHGYITRRYPQWRSEETRP